MYSVGGPSESPEQLKERKKRQVMARDNLLHLFTELGGDDSIANKFKRSTRSLDKNPNRTLVFSIIVSLMAFYLGFQILRWVGKWMGVL